MADKNKTYKHRIIIASLALTFFTIPIYKSFQNNYLYAIDPWVHMYMTQHGEPKEYYTQKITLSDKDLDIHYPTMMRSFLFVFHQVTGIDYIIIFKLFGFLTRFILLLIILSITRRMTTQKSYYLVLFTLLIFSHYYYRFRSWLTFTENFVLLFHTLLFWAGAIHLGQKEFRSKYFYLACLLLSFALRFHKPSFIVPSFFIGIWGLLSLLKRGWKRSYVYALLLFIIISLPVITGLVQEYSRQLKENVGKTTGYGDLSRFKPPQLNDYIRYSSGILVMMGLSFPLFLFQKKQYDSSTIFTICCFAFTFLLSNTTRVGLNLPQDRMQGFLMPTLAIIGCISLYNFIRKSSATTVLMIFFILFLMSFGITMRNRSRIRVVNGERLIGEYLTETYDNQKLYYFSGINFMATGFPYLNNISLSGKNLSDGDYIIQYKNKKKAEDQPEIIHQEGKIEVVKYKKQ